jgi:DNA-directed RNA polymerase subunit RPC12/RpoP
MPDEYEVDYSSPLSNPVKSYYCYDCHLEMSVENEKDARCPKCGAPGHKMTFKCPKCKNNVTVFHPDQHGEIHCFCNRE